MKVMTIVFLVNLLTACGGGSGGDSVFGNLSDDPPLAELVGTWAITEEWDTISQSSDSICDELEIDSEPELFEIVVTDQEKECTSDFPKGTVVEGEVTTTMGYECQTAANEIVFTYEAVGSGRDSGQVDK